MSPWLLVLCVLALINAIANPEAARDELNALAMIIKVLLWLGSLAGAVLCFYLASNDGDAGTALFGVVLLIPIVISGFKASREEKQHKRLVDDIKAGRVEWDDVEEMWVSVSPRDPRYGKPRLLRRPYNDYV
jgi:hypothetical protein